MKMSSKKQSLRKKPTNIKIIKFNSKFSRGDAEGYGYTWTHNLDGGNMLE